MKKIFSLILVLSLFLATGCMGGENNNANETNEETTNTETNEETTYKVGISQFVQHDALDAATEGFSQALTDEFGDKVEITVSNASGQADVCSTIANQFITDGVDLIMANATPALQAAAAATGDIPILGTSVTEYGVALEIDDFDGLVGTNVSGTSDLAPLEEQAKMFEELLPDANTIGILYCSSEANSKYQVEEVQKYLEEMGKTVKLYPFTDSNDVGTFTTNAIYECDALYIPTDNTAAASTETINNIALRAGVPIIAGEKNTMVGCGVGTLSIDYYQLGYTTGQMAVKILKGEADVKEMPIEYYTNPVKIADKARCEQLGIEIPEGYEIFE